MDNIHEQLKSKVSFSDQIGENQLALVECIKEQTENDTDKMQIIQSSLPILENKQSVGCTSEIEDVFGGSHISKVN